MDKQTLDPITGTELKAIVADAERRNKRVWVKHEIREHGIYLQKQYRGDDFSCVKVYWWVPRIGCRSNNFTGDVKVEIRKGVSKNSRRGWAD